MSNLRANRNLVAIAGVTAFRFGSLLELFIRSMNCFTACMGVNENEKKCDENRRWRVINKLLYDCGANHAEENKTVRDG